MYFMHLAVCIIGILFFAAVPQAEAKTVECYCADGHKPVDGKCILPGGPNGETRDFSATCNSSYNDSNDVIESGNYTAIAAIPKKVDSARPWLPVDRHIYSWTTTNEVSIRQAEADALQACREGAHSRKKEKYCRIIASYHNACSANVSGYAMRNGKAVYKEYFKSSRRPNAHNLALAECQAEFGSMNHCWVNNTDCFIEHSLSRTRKMQRMQKR